MKAVIVQKWTDYERGWGSRPGGATLHRTLADRREFLDEEVGSRSFDDAVPDEYSSPTGDAYAARVEDSVYERLQDVNAIWVVDPPDPPTQEELLAILADPPDDVDHVHVNLNE